MAELVGQPVGERFERGERRPGLRQDPVPEGRVGVLRGEQFDDPPGVLQVPLQDPFLRRLQRRAADRNEAGLSRRWRYALELAFFTLMRHLEDVEADTRDRCLYAVLERVTAECRTGVVDAPGRPLIDRIDRRPRALR